MTAYELAKVYAECGGKRGPASRYCIDLYAPTLDNWFELFDGLCRKHGLQFVVRRSWASPGFVAAWVKGGETILIGCCSQRYDETISGAVALACRHLHKHLPKPKSEVQAALNGGEWKTIGTITEGDYPTVKIRTVAQ